MSEPASAPHGPIGNADLTITVNGEPRQVPQGSSVADLLAALSASLSATTTDCGPAGPARYAVEINRAIVPRSRHSTHALAEGDLVEIVTFVGGG